MKLRLNIHKFNLLAVIVILSLCLMAFRGMFGKTRQLLNNYSIPVAVTAKYHAGKESDSREIDVVVPPNALYEELPEENGDIYYEYVAMPNVASNVMARARQPYTKGPGEDVLRFVEGMKAERMPGDWVEKYKDNYPLLLQYYESDMAESTNESNSAEIIRKKKERAFYYHSITNFNPSLLDTISNPDFDSDSDGLTNRDEFYCGSNPLLKEGIVCGPTYLEIVPGSGLLSTGSFYVINLTDTNSFAFFRTYVDEKYRPKMVCPPGNLVSTGAYDAICVKVPPKGKVKIDTIFKTNLLTCKLGQDYEIQLRCSFDVMNAGLNKGTIHPWLNSEPKVLLKPAILSRPKDGEKFRHSDDHVIKFEWKDLERQGNGEEASYRVFLYQVNGKFLGGTSEWASKSVHNCFLSKRLDPGTYVWRVIKMVDFQTPVASEWGWFSIGKEIAPEKTGRKPPAETSRNPYFTRLGYYCSMTAESPFECVLDIPDYASNYVMCISGELPPGLGLADGEMRYCFD